MPIHDWTRVPSGLFHHFHQDWSIEIARTLNRGRLPNGLSALVDKRPRPASRIVVRRHLRRIIAIMEIVSPGNKDSHTALRGFVDMAIDCLRSGIHLLLVDLFPPTPRDPYGMHKAIWDEMDEGEFYFPEGKDRLLASYNAADVPAAYVDPVGVGDVLGDMPLFLTNDSYVPVPLEPTYQATWDASPEELRIAVETGVLPEPDMD
jgi:hypothetical protein